MATLEDVKIPLFSGLKDEYLERLAALATVSVYETEQVVFKHDELATHLYILKSGRALLESDLSNNVTATVSSIQPGFLMGIAALLQDGKYQHTAVCVEQSELVAIPGHDLLELMDTDHSLGYALSKCLLDFQIGRKNTRTEQFLKVITMHPELKAAL